MIPGSARQPRGIVQINGVSVLFESAEVNNNTFYGADTFRVRLPVSVLPSNMNMGVLLSTTDLYVEIFAGLPTNPSSYSTADMQSLIYGKADAVDWDFRGGYVELSGRDLTSTMIDAKTDGKYVNQTSSQIAATIAQRHGLSSHIVPTSTTVGRYYEIDHIRLNSDRTEWDLLTYLAREEGYVVFVQGQTLYFQPSPPAVATVAFNFTPVPNGPAQGDGTTLKVQHAKTLAKDITVTVHSWNSKQAKGFTKVAKASHTSSGLGATKGAISNGTPQNYSYVIPNLDAGQAAARASQILAELSKHEMKIEIEGPAANSLSRTDVIQISGTNSPADTLFFISSIVRRLSPTEGYAWTVSAKNHSPETTVTPS